MQRILVLNAKGGCGKTTIATNLAGYFADSGMVTALMDHDPQGSSMRWLSLRPAERPDIVGIAAYQRRRGVTRSFQLAIPSQVQCVVMDAPAGIAGLQLADFVQSVDTIILPVLPSPIDIHAAAHFIQDLLLIGKIRRRGIRLGIVANRVRENTLVLRDLERFLGSLEIPLVARLRDSQNHMRAAELGLSISELEGRRVEHDRQRWEELFRWLEQQPAGTDTANDPAREPASSPAPHGTAGSGSA